MQEHGDAYGAIVLVGTDGPLSATQKMARAIAAAQRTIVGGRSRDRFLTRLVFGGFNKQFAPNRTGFDWLSRDDAEVDAYVADALCGLPLTLQSWLDFLAGRSVLTTTAQLARIPKGLPVHVLNGSRDPVGGNGRGVERLISAYRQAGLRHVSSVTYEDARHELFHETNRRQVLQELAEWLARLCRSSEGNHVGHH
jgi:alpha-beta hydrolase superfamily lysophospholipase